VSYLALLVVGNNILLLGGTLEAFEIAECFHKVSNINVITSLAGATRSPRFPKGKFRTGGFGGVEGLKNYLIKEKISLVVDATHPFAEKITKNAAKAGEKIGIPVLHFCRSPWQKKENDVWHIVENAQQAARKLLSDKFTETSDVFLTIGSGAPRFFSDIKNIRFYIRSVERPTRIDSFSNMEWIEGRGPFSFKDEYDLFQKHKIGCLITKNSGGPASEPKIEAARSFGVPVIMISRTSPLNLDQITDVNRLISISLDRLSQGVDLFIRE
jgi:precorrin-6A/cobalt-precorrin-6A reductase